MGLPGTGLKMVPERSRCRQGPTPAVPHPLTQPGLWVPGDGEEKRWLTGVPLPGAGPSRGGGGRRGGSDGGQPPVGDSGGRSADGGGQWPSPRTAQHRVSATPDEGSPENKAALSHWHP